MPYWLPWLAALVMAVPLTTWIVIAVSVHFSRKALPSAGANAKAPEPEGGWPKLSIIVPAHNEEAIIEECLLTLRAQQYANLEIILSLDRCTDGTLAIVQKHAADDERIRIVENSVLRDDWHGKCLPMQLGAEAATGDWLLFVDADTQMQPALSRASIAIAKGEGFDMLGVLPDLRCEKLFEHVAQPVATMQLMYIFPPHKVNRMEKPRPFGLGPFIMVRRAAFEDIGGMGAIKGGYQEDVALARAVQRGGYRVGLALSGGLFGCAMYESYEAFKVGWKRIYIGVCDRKPKRLSRYGVRLLLIGLGLPLLQLGGLITGVLALAASLPLGAAAVLTMTALSLAAQLYTLTRINRSGGASWAAAFLFPLGAWAVAKILLESADDLRKRRPIRWGGRDYVVEPR